jgi:hypothetical protein
MLAGRLIRAARDILGEYGKFRIIERLNHASTLSANRGGPQAQQYPQQARDLRAWAQSVLDQSVIETYPDDLQMFLKNSDYSTALPASIARVVLAGFPDNMNLAMSSSEIGLYTQLANTLLSELGSLTKVADKMHIAPITIPASEISFDILIPRNIFDDSADAFVSLLARFSRIMSYLNELTTGSQKSPVLVYTSTSDPVTGLAVASATAWAVLNFYKLALEVAEKQFSLLRTLQAFRQAFAPDATSDVEERVKNIVDGALKQAVDGTVASVPASVPEERVNEIKTALTIDARVAVNAIAHGTRISITVESLDRINDIGKSLPDVTPDILKERLGEQKVLEQQVHQSLVSLGQPAPALLSDETATGDRPS